MYIVMTSISRKGKSFPKSEVFEAFKLYTLLKENENVELWDNDCVILPLKLYKSEEQKKRSKEKLTIFTENLVDRANIMGIKLNKNG